MMEEVRKNSGNSNNFNEMTMLREKKDNSFMISFIVENKNIMLKNLINFKLYELIFKLNNDIIEDVAVTHEIDDDHINMIIKLKAIGQELGLPKRYCFININKTVETNLIKFTSNTINIDNDTINKHKCLGEEIKNTSSTMYIELLNDHKAKINFTLFINPDEDMPGFMDNMVSLLLKKIFVRVKSFIEKIQ
tara:strand:+ start:194 stop:769 length:576 start_codon:yes stop_codon:yes gene_type:complete